VERILFVAGYLRKFPDEEFSRVVRRVKEYRAESHR
jgi:hypothetical protein